MSDLDAAIAANKAALAAMSPVDRALHDSEQRRSWVRGMTCREPPRDVLADEVRRLREELAARGAAAFKRGAEAMREAAAREIECGCDPDRRARVLAVPPNSGARWEACGEANCCAIDAAAIRALPAPEDRNNCEMEEDMGVCPWEEAQPDPDIQREDRDERRRLEREDRSHEG